MTISSTWIVLDKMCYRVLENDLPLVLEIFHTAMNDVLNIAYPDDEIRRLQIPHDFYERALLHYARISSPNPLFGFYGLNNYKEGDTVIHIDFEKMKIFSEIAGIPQDIDVRRQEIVVL